MSTRLSSQLLKRYSPAERTNHWLTALSFVLLALSGLALFHPAFFWLSQIFGGGTWTRIIHPYIGVVLFLSFAVMALRYARHNLLGANDWIWLSRIRDVVKNHEDRLPEVDRYNAGQKLLFWVLVLAVPTLLASGIVIWRPWFADEFAIPSLRLAVLVHAIAAFVMMAGIIVHIYAALWVKGTIRAMVRGTVTRAWAQKHHGGWYKRALRGEDA